MVINIASHSQKQEDVVSNNSEWDFGGETRMNKNIANTGVIEHSKSL